MLAKSTVDLNELKLFRSRASDFLEMIGVLKHEGIRLPHAFKIFPYSMEIFSVFPDLKRIISLSLESDEWCLTGHSDLHKNALSGWHRDDGTSYGDGGYFGEFGNDYSKEERGVFKVAVYLQHHNIIENGLSVSVGSHMASSRMPERDIYLPTDLGDIVVFDPRIYHAGQLSKTPKPVDALDISRATASSAKAGSAMTQENIGMSPNEIMFETSDPDRLSLFFTLRRKTSELRSSAITFELNNMRRQIFEITTQSRSTFAVNGLTSSAMEECALRYGISFSRHINDLA